MKPKRFDIENCKTEADFYGCLYRVVQKKTAQSLMHRHFEPFAVESRGFTKMLRN